MNLRVACVPILAVMILAAVVESASAAPKPKRGVTSGFFADAFDDVPLTSAGFSVIHTFDSLNPGEYVANATVVLRSSDPQFHVVECAFLFGNEIFRSGVSGSLGGSSNNHLTLPLTIGFSLDSPRAVGVACRPDAGNIVHADASQISLIRVDELITDGSPVVIP